MDIQEEITRIQNEISELKKVSLKIKEKEATLKKLLKLSEKIKEVINAH